MEYFWRAKNFLPSIYDIKNLGHALYFVCVEFRQDSKSGISFIMKTYIDRVRKKILCGSTLIAPATKVKDNKDGHFSVQGTIMN